MGEFSYGKSISDSFKLVFGNLYIFVPLLIGSAIGMLMSQIFSGLFNPVNINLDYILSHLSLLLLALVGFVILMAISYFSYGWFFALIGQIVKKGKASLSEELKNAPRKGWNYFLITLSMIVVLFGLIIIFMAPLIILGFILKSGLIAGISTAIVISLMVVAIVILVLAIVHTIPIVSMDNIGPINTIKNSFNHFNNNRLHTLALVGIIILFMIPTIALMYLILFLSIGSFTDTQLIEYMLTYPIKYSVISAISGLPVMLMSGWVYAFLTVSYIRKKRLVKEQA